MCYPYPMSDTDAPTHPGHGERALWIAVVLRAVADIASEPLGSVEYNDATVFFTAGGEWAFSRSAVAGHVDLHPDDLERAGRRCIAARRAAEGMPVEILPTKVSPPQGPLPRLEAIPPREKLSRQPRERRDRHWWIAKFMAQHAA
jgi:hypothetical protein